MVHGKSCVALVENTIESLGNCHDKLKRLEKTSEARLNFSPYVELFISRKIPVEDVEAGLPTLSLFKNHRVPCFTSYMSTLVDAFGDVYPCCYAYFDNQAYGAP